MKKVSYQEKILSEHARNSCNEKKSKASIMDCLTQLYMFSRQWSGDQDDRSKQSPTIWHESITHRVAFDCATELICTLRSTSGSLTSKLVPSKLWNREKECDDIRATLQYQLVVFLRNLEHGTLLVVLDDLTLQIGWWKSGSLPDSVVFLVPAGQFQDRNMQ